MLKINNFYIFISIASFLAILITFFLGKFFSKKPVVKYIPAMAAALAGIGFYIKSAYFSTGFEDLGYFVLTLIACIVFFLSFITAFILGIIHRNRSNQS